jgi:hypothetical protein
MAQRHRKLFQDDLREVSEVASCANFLSSSTICRRHSTPYSVKAVVSRAAEMSPAASFTYFERTGERIR